MNTFEQAARQALDALEAHADIGIKADKAIIALRQALEQAARQALEQKPCDMGAMCLDCQPRGANGECPDQQPKQEPVAWGAFYFGGKRNGKLYSACDTKEQIEHYIADRHQSDDSNTFRAAPLYTEPPKREWVRLTDEDIEQGKKETWGNIRAWRSAVWWAEERLKELNT